MFFSDIDGLYDRGPRLHPEADMITRIEHVDDHIHSLAGGAGSRRGKGGMKTKLQAAALATAQGVDTIITNGKNPYTLYDILEEKSVGTLFVGKV